MRAILVLLFAPITVRCSHETLNVDREQSVGSSDSVLEACKNLLCFRHELPNNGPSNLQDSSELLKSSGLLGVEYGVHESGLLYGAFQLLHACSVLAPSFVRRLDEIGAANIACWQLQSGGSNKLRPVCVLAAAGWLYLYTHHSASPALG